MSLVKERHRIVLSKFQELLRSGKDYGVKYMYDEAGKVVFIEGISVMRIINKHYKDVINQDMVDYFHQLDCSREEKIKQFSDKFEVCIRESILRRRW
jgi:late competence protein required for DNA uptake (superfamily II DNA/RNA helicase)